MSIIALAVLLILGTALINCGVNNLQQASRERDAAEAYNLAEAAADMAEAYLRSLPAPPSWTSKSYPTDGSAVTLATGTCHAIIQSAPDNDGTWLKRYTITGTGTSRSGRVQYVIVQLREQSFALYSYFTDSEISPNGDTVWFYARDHVYGPVHSNDRFHISWANTSAAPIFSGSVSSHASSVDWSPRAPATVNDWRRVLDAGQSALTLNTDRIPLPLTSDMQKCAAWGSDYNFPTSDGVYLPKSGSEVTAGIYVRGNCTVEFYVESSTGRQGVVLKQGSTTTNVWVDLVNNCTAVKVNNEKINTYTGVPNGVLYCTGNITSLKGQLADNYYSGQEIVRPNAWTVVANPDGEKSITITSNLTYKSTPDADQPATHPKNLRAATLGLVAKDVILDEECPNNLTIHGVMLAGGENLDGGSFYNEEWNGEKKNDLTVLGGIIQKKRGAVGMYNPYNNVHTNGYSKNYVYDPRLANNPPPFFPTTGQYDVLSWQQQ